MSPVGWLHYKSSLTGGRDALPLRVLARTNSLHTTLTHVALTVHIIVLNPFFSTQAIRVLIHLTKVIHMTSTKENQEEKQKGIQVIVFITPINFVCHLNVCIIGRSEIQQGTGASFKF